MRRVFAKPGDETYTHTLLWSGGVITVEIPNQKHNNERVQIYRDGELWLQYLRIVHEVAQGQYLPVFVHGGQTLLRRCRGHLISARLEVCERTNRRGRTTICVNLREPNWMSPQQATHRVICVTGQAEADALDWPGKHVFRGSGTSGGGILVVVAPTVLA